MVDAPKDMAASVRQRLLNLSRREEQLFDVVLVAFGLERLLYRLSISEYRDRFVLKGGLLVTLWTIDGGRFTRDIDFLRLGQSDGDELRDIFSDILNIEADDGLIFDAGNLKSFPIREDQIYGGMRLKTTAFLGKTRIPITIDIGFGDAILDPEIEIDFPSLLDFPSANIRAYSPANVIAEKFHAVVTLGLVNGRMKDFYDLWAIPRAKDIPDTDLDAAIKATFRRRDTIIPIDRPDGLTTDFTMDAQKISQWLAYAGSVDLEGFSLSKIADEIWTYIGPACARIAAS